MTTAPRGAAPVPGGGRADGAIAREPGGDPADLRMPLLALAAWGGALAGWALDRAGGRAPLVGSVVAVLLVLGATAGVVLDGRADGRAPGAGRRWTTLLAATVLAAALVALVLVRGAQVRTDPLAALAARRAAAEVELVVTDDPRPVPSRFEDLVVLRAEVRLVEVDGRAWRSRSPVVVLGDAAWAGVRLGSRVRADVRLAPADGDAAAMVDPRGPPEVLRAPDVWWRAADVLRSALRSAVAGRPADQRALVPALVDGDASGITPELSADFATTGLTHLMAVSGTNLTLLLGAVLVLARAVGVRGRGLPALGALTIAGFVLLARTEPSVLRAAVMGGVALGAFGADRGRRGPRTLGAAVVVLLVLDPGLAVSAGFALSVSATAGILFLAPGWRDALARWLPGWAAEAIAVPLAAQAACTPLVAVLSAQVSLVAVLTNLAAAPAVGPATVLGLAAGVAWLVWHPLGTLLGTVAGWCVGWILHVAHAGAALPTAAIGWRTDAWSILLLTLLSAAVVLLGPRLVRTPVRGTTCAAALVLVVAVPVPRPGWPPEGWVMVACDVGQGDGLVLATGSPGEAVVVDAGPDPRLIEHCLDGLGIDRVPYVVLTHFHADHVDGLPGVLAGRRVGAVLTTTLLDPPGGVAAVRAETAAAGVPLRTVVAGASWRVGDLDLTTLWPPPGPAHPGPGDGSTANDGSVVMVARTEEVSLMLSGDAGPDPQARMSLASPGLTVDVLKVPHHGSRYQDLDWLTSLHARLAVVSVGVDNDYGHPNADLLRALAGAGMRVLRTDTDGAVAVTALDGRLGAVTER